MKRKIICFCMAALLLAGCSTPAEPSSTPDTTPTDTKTEPEQKAKIPVLVPVLILSIAGVITATVLVVRSGRGKEDF